MNLRAAIPSQDNYQEKEISHDCPEEIVTETDFLQKSQKQGNFHQKINTNWILFNCSKLMNLNSQIMIIMDQKLNQAQAVLDQGNNMLKEQNQKHMESLKRSSEHLWNAPEKAEQNLFKSSNSLTKTLFGNINFRYKLVLEGHFTKTLYKERNFNITVKLVDLSSGKQRYNGNIVNLSLGICDDNGEWIYETKEGLPFVKGKNQSELYHGNATFLKMSLRDVSRIFANKTVNIVIYPKPSVLRYSGQSSLEEHVDFSEIEPLIIQRVTVKAKKRE